jgi:hypothetical protein
VSWLKRRTCVRATCIFTWFLTCFWLAACSSLPLSAPDKSAQYTELGKGWWDFSFDLLWPEGQEPNWYLDELIAQRIIGPEIEKFADDINLWRFHRRAMRDEAGHRFSFIVYTSSTTAANIRRNIENNAIYHVLVAQGQITALLAQDFGKNPKPEIEATSDTQWSLELQKSWPYFIMGASRAWLDLIARYEAELPPLAENFNFEQLQSRYLSIDARMAATWQAEGQHAFLHHLNALFGYVPLMYTERRYMNF